jgi:hypothetical protein
MRNELPQYQTYQCYVQAVMWVACCLLGLKQHGTGGCLSTRPAAPYASVWQYAELARVRRLSGAGRASSVDTRDAEPLACYQHPQINKSQHPTASSAHAQVRNAKKEELEEKLLSAALPPCKAQLTLLAKHLAGEFTQQLTTAAATETFHFVHDTTALAAAADTEFAQVRSPPTEMCRSHPAGVFADAMDVSLSMRFIYGSRVHRRRRGRLCQRWRARGGWTFATRRQAS